jgi:hypothetical protein
MFNSFCKLAKSYNLILVSVRIGCSTLYLFPKYVWCVLLYRKIFEILYAKNIFILFIIYSYLLNKCSLFICYKSENKTILLVAHP